MTFFLAMAVAQKVAALGERQNVHANAAYRQEGDADGRTLFAVDCSSHLWVSVVAADEDSRSVLFIALDDNAGGVCISSMTTSVYSCSDSTPGPELKPGASLTDFTTGAWNCRSRANNVDTLNGYRAKHSLD